MVDRLNRANEVAAFAFPGIAFVGIATCAVWIIVN